MKPALLLIDLQSDFIERKGLVPGTGTLIGQLERLLSGCRDYRVPVIHIHTQIRADGLDRMPHWKRKDAWYCVEGSSGAMPPESLQPAGDEPVITKQFFSGFGNPALEAALNHLDIDTVIVAGLYLHGCVRSTVLDAYERGYEVLVVDDATGSTETDHAEITRLYLDDRAAEFVDTHHLLRQLGKNRPSRTGRSGADILPVANIGGNWIKANDRDCVIRCNPCSWSEVIATVPLATGIEVNEGCTTAAKAQHLGNHESDAERAALLEEWANVLGGRRDELARLLALEIGKPLTDGYDEIQRAISLVQVVAGQLRYDQIQKISGDIHVRTRPHGVIGLVTPWNNPVAIPVGKLAPALAYGNAVVWKPAIEAPRTAITVMESLQQAGAAPGLVNLVFGGATTARHVIGNSHIAAVSLTGSIASGRSVAALCTHFGKPLQAELGGNNAAIVLRDCNIQEHARQMARSAFSFAGQRCTAIQRFIVERSIIDEFLDKFIAAVESLQVGDPNDRITAIGPLVSRTHRQWICSCLERATMDGAHIYYGGTTPKGLERGCWLTPAVIGNVNPDSVVARDEVFGPVAVVLPVDNIDEAIKTANGVEYGLVAALYASNAGDRRRFADAVQAGILQFAAGPLDVHPAAPFGGWKASAIGPPEHGRWDRQFYGRVQTVYSPPGGID